MAHFHELKIAEITQETGEAVSLQFDVPVTLNDSFQFAAGQYLNLSADINGNEVRRAYSICSAPDSGKLTVLVKKVENGLFSTYANERLSKGDVLKVAAPEGRFVLPEPSGADEHYIFFAAGSGITPIMSMIEDLLKNRPNTQIVLVYGNKAAEQTIFKNRLDALQAEHPEKLNIEWVYSRQQTDSAHFGRCDRSKVAYTVNNKYKEISFEAFFICGPGNMIDEVAGALADFGIADDKINFERFTVSEAADTEAETSDVPAGNAQITYIIDDESTTVTVPTSTSVLESAMKNDLDPPYSCQGGICSSCIARVTDGSVEMRKNQILTDSEVSEGLVLTCQAHATSAQVTVDYDDV